MKENITKQIEKEMALDYARWDYLYTEGGSDPNWADGCNLNLIRNHIIYHKRKMEELQYFPDIYYRKLPPRVDNSYMAHADKIRTQAKKSLEEYLADADYNYIKDNIDKISPKDAERMCLYNILGYVSGLRCFIKEDNLVRMRLHMHPEFYKESFQRGRRKLQTILGSIAKDREIWSISEDRTGQLTFSW